MRARASAVKRGAAAVEAAMVMPMLLTLLLGIWDFGRLVEANQIVNNAAREAGRQASTGQKTSAQVQQAVRNCLTRSGVSTDGVTITVMNMTTPGRTDPTTANQLDEFRLVVTVPSDNVRLILLSSLLGRSTIQATTYWTSMMDIPLAVDPSIPIN